MGLAEDPHKELLREAGWHTRGYLPHFDGASVPQTITLHLSDAVPLKVIERWQSELKDLNDEHKLVLMQQRIDRYLDQGYGECLLKLATIAKLVQDSLLNYDNVRYQLFAWCVMPNHEHSLLTRLKKLSSKRLCKHTSHTQHIKLTKCFIVRVSFGCPSTTIGSFETRSIFITRYVTSKTTLLRHDFAQSQVTGPLVVLGFERGVESRVHGSETIDLIVGPKDQVQ
jgi:REP element-mobilizing transposase RayT